MPHQNDVAFFLTTTNSSFLFLSAINLCTMKQFVAALCIATALFACKGEEKKAEKKFNEKTYEENKESLADKEKNNPARFLKVDNRDRGNLIGQTVVIGHLTNTATVCTYKDVDVKMTFYSKTGTKLDEAIETVYETIPPGKTVKFKLKQFAAKGTDNVKVEVIKAVGQVK
jgi:hypothetical protein